MLIWLSWAQGEEERTLSFADFYEKVAKHAAAGASRPKRPMPAVQYAIDKVRWEISEITFGKDLDEETGKSGRKQRLSQGNSSMNTTSGAGVNSGVTGVSLGQNGSFGVNAPNFGFNVGSGTSGGKLIQQFDSRIWGTQSPYLSDVWSGSGRLQQHHVRDRWPDPDMTAQVQDAFSRGMGDFGNALGGGFAAGMMDQVGPNTYTDALKGDIINDAGKLKEQTLGTLDARAAAAGMSGGSGYRDRWPTLQPDR